MVDNIQKISTADTLAKDFYRFTVGRPGTEHRKTFSVLYKVNELDLKNDFEQRLEDVFIQHNKQPKKVEDILRDEFTGSLEKRSLAIYKKGTDEGVQTTFGDKVKSLLEKSVEFPVNHPFAFLVGMAGLTGTFLLKNRTFAKTAIGVGTSALATTVISGADDYKYSTKLQTIA